MNVPFHPMIVHFPLALTFILPVLILVFAYMIKFHKMAPHAWLIIVGMQLMVTITGYVALDSGEADEERVAKVIGKDLIHKHEEAAEIFVGSTVLILAISITALFIRKEIQFPLKLSIAVLSLVSCFLAYRTGTLGGELVYVHGAGQAFSEEAVSTGQEAPAAENESLEVDENDYGPGDEVVPEDENYKQED